MARRLHPFQKICYVSGTSERPHVVVAAAGPSIAVFDLSQFTLLSLTSPLRAQLVDDGVDAEDSAYGPSPAKRRKIGPSSIAPVSREDSEESVEIISERRKGERKKPKVEDPKLPNVSHLLATSGGQTIFAVTTEDKSISVLSLENSGQLSLRSRRSMPKRICSITLTPDEGTIISADKFGDVYSLPLNPSDSNSPLKPGLDSRNGTFQPAATELTVHTKGNLEALRQQQQQKSITPRKEGPDFDHKLLLGHVSLLTDVAIATIEIDSKPRQFILTSDRDEHVRVSRYPQAHIIHGYCLGFREFVSKLCVIPWAQHHLIVGDGQPSLKLFDWRTTRLISHVDFSEPVLETLQTLMADPDRERSQDKLAVSGVWPFPLTDSARQSSSTKTAGGVLVALEGLPVLLSFTVQLDGQLRYHQTISLSGNVLDVAVAPGGMVTALVSIDSIHVPGSMIREKSDLAECNLITALKFDGKDMKWSSCTKNFNLKTTAEAAADIPMAPEAQATGSSRARGEYSTLGEFLYGLENLRKKREIAEELDDSVVATEELAPEDVP